MSDRDLPNPQFALLLRWLLRARARLRMQRSLRDASWTACGMLGLLVAYRSLAILVREPAVVAGLMPLLILTGVALLAWLGWRLSRVYSLAQAAAAADRQGALHDEIKSAYCFACERSTTPVIESMLRRAARTVDGLDPRELFPLGFPRSLVVALGLAAAATALAWMPSKTTGDAQGAQGSGVTRVGPLAPGSGQVGRSVPEGAAGAGPGEQSAARRAVQAQNWARVQEMARSIEGAEGEALRQAIAARDAQGAIQALESGAKGDAAGQASGAAARAPARQVSEAFAQSIIERLKSLLDTGQAQEAEAGAPAQEAATQAAARISPRGERPAESAPAGEPGQHALREDSLNMQLRSIARTGTSQGQAVAGRGEGWEEGGRTNASTGAMGQRMGVSGAGAGEDNPAQGNPVGDAPSDPVLGKPTARLAAQLQQVGGARAEQTDADSAAQTLYGATRAQASSLAYRAQTAAPRESGEEAMSREATPVGYRTAVKNYFLTQHGKEQ